MFVQNVIMNYFPGKQHIFHYLPHCSFIKIFCFSETKYSHESPWPAFTETYHQDSVSKYEEKPGALKVISKFENKFSDLLMLSLGELWQMWQRFGTRVPRGWS